MYGGRERGQGCFLFSQLIDSQMSGGVGFVAELRHRVTPHYSQNKHCTSAHWLKAYVQVVTLVFDHTLCNCPYNVNILNILNI